MSKRILFVDGDHTIVQAVNGMLEGMGHTVRLETSGMDALTAFSNNPADFDLVITDLGMPDISGLLLVEKFLKMRADIPIVLLTGLDGQAQSRARENGVHWFGMKPLSLAALAETVESALMGAA
jgi:two-component system, cell cycle sensor histidine kinase and response regulator CckA